MIETEAVVTYRARPKCSQCGWVGDWRSSTRTEAAATERATLALAGHANYWHH